MCCTITQTRKRGNCEYIATSREVSEYYLPATYIVLNNYKGSVVLTEVGAILSYYYTTGLLAMVLRHVEFRRVECPFVAVVEHMLAATFPVCVSSLIWLVHSVGNSQVLKPASYRHAITRLLVFLSFTLKYIFLIHFYRS